MQGGGSMEGNARARRRCGPPPVHAPGSALKKSLKLIMRGYQSEQPSALLRAVERSQPLTAGRYDKDEDSDYFFEKPTSTRGQVNTHAETWGEIDDSSSGDNDQAGMLNGSCSLGSNESTQGHTSKVNVFDSPTYKSYKEKEVRSMMETIGGILNESSDEQDQSFVKVPAEDPEQSSHDIGTFVVVDSSMDSSLNDTNFSSFSDFDTDGRLATTILKKMHTRDEAEEHAHIKNKEKLFELSPKIKCLKATQVRAAPVENKHNKLEKRHIKLKDKPVALTQYSDSDSSVNSEQHFRKKKRSEKVKTAVLSDSVAEIVKPLNAKKSKSSKNNSNTDKSNYSPPYVSIDAVGKPLPCSPSLLQQYSSANNKMYSESKRQGKNSRTFQASKTCLRNAIINEVSDTLLIEDSEIEDHNICHQSNSSRKCLVESSIHESSVNSPPQCVENNRDGQMIANSTSVGIKCLQNGCIMILRHPAQIYLHGKVRIAALCGSADVLGYRLQEQSSEIYAPRYNHALTIQTEGVENDQFGLFGKLTRAGVSVAETEDVVTSLGEYDSVFYLQPLKNKKFDFIDKNFTADIFSRANKVISKQFPEAAEVLSCSMSSDKPNKYFVESPVWKEVIEFGLETNGKGIVCGGKGTGKSTFLRYYVNKMLAQGPVVVIDLDPGQSELTVAGNVSVAVVKDPMIGPNFTHLQTPKRMLNLGMVNVLDNLERYTNAVMELFDYCAEQPEFENMPWIINTMGMCNSLGLKLITYIISIAKPTFLVEMDSNVTSKSFKLVLNAEQLKNIYLEEYQQDPIFQNTSWPEDLNFKHFVSRCSKLSEKSANSPKDERYLNFLAYFGNLLSNSTDDNLLAIRPYVVQLKSLRVRSTVKFNEELFMQVVNGKIVALCEDNSASADRTFIVEEKPLLCHGHGLIRGIDEETESLYIISPVPKEVLKKVNTIVYSEVYPDLLLDDGHLAPGTVVPYRIPLQDHNRQLTMTPKRRFNPLLLLKMKRQAAA